MVDYIVNRLVVKERATEEQRYYLVYQLACMTDKQLESQYDFIRMSQR